MLDPRVEAWADASYRGRVCMFRILVRMIVLLVNFVSFSLVLWCPSASYDSSASLHVHAFVLLLGPKNSFPMHDTKQTKNSLYDPAYRRREWVMRLQRNVVFGIQLPVDPPERHFGVVHEAQLHICGTLMCD